jgi:hypothetical protein
MGHGEFLGIRVLTWAQGFARLPYENFILSLV